MTDFFQRSLFHSKAGSAKPHKLNGVNSKAWGGAALKLLSGLLLSSWLVTGFCDEESTIFSDTQSEDNQPIHQIPDKHKDSSPSTATENPVNEKQESAATFTPTEEVSEDLSVPFPVDI